MPRGNNRGRPSYRDVRCSTKGCWGDRQRMYVRETVSTYGEKQKQRFVSVGWGCRKCGKVKMDDSFVVSDYRS